MNKGNDYMASLDYIRENLDAFRAETREQLRENTKELRRMALHQKEQNGNVASIAECVSRLTVLTDDMRERMADHRERLARLEASGEWQTKEQDETKEAVEWTRDRVWDMANKIAGLAAKVAVGGAAIWWVVENLM